MKILRTKHDLKKAINKIKNLGFVPTMGSIHNGHISLIKKSKLKCYKTLVSIYINPNQFNNKKDFSKYPRDIKRDLKILKKHKVNFVFTPSTKEIFKEKRINKIILPNNQKILCAKFRKGHFEGVLDIMDRFIKLVNPKYTFMGEKDFQQLFLVKKFIEKKFKNKIYSCRTVRDRNFLALSSRNYLLSKNELNKAGQIAKYLFKLKSSLKKISQTHNNILIKKKELQKKFNIKIDYLEVRNEKNLTALTKNKKIKLFVAYYINKVRLIDNF
jgi:pantoate--beta-alanine ligase